LSHYRRRTTAPPSRRRSSEQAFQDTLVIQAPLGTHIAYAAQTPGTWAGGTTRALYADPPEAIATPAAARAWVGTAVIERPAPYSHFADRIRLQIPIQGNGIRLRFQAPPELVVLEPFAQHRFDGARPVEVELQAGPIVAFNLIVRADVFAEAQVVALEAEPLLWQLGAPPLPAGAASGLKAVRLIYLISGALTLQLAEQAALTLHPDDGFVVEPSGLPAPLLVPQASSRVVLATLWLP